MIGFLSGTWFKCWVCMESYYGANACDYMVHNFSQTRMLLSSDFVRSCNVRKIQSSSRLAILPPLYWPSLKYKVSTRYLFSLAFDSLSYK